MNLEGFLGHASMQVTCEKPAFAQKGGERRENLIIMLENLHVQYDLKENEKSF